MLRKVVQFHRHIANAYFAASTRAVPLSSSIRFSSSSIPDEGAKQDPHSDSPTTAISIDRSSLYNPPGSSYLSIYLSLFNSPSFFPNLFFSLLCVAEHSHQPNSDSDLVDHLKGIIKVSF